MMDMLMKLTREQSGITAIFAGIVAIGIYGFMINVTLPHIQEISQLVPFDMRPLGYSKQEAEQLLAALELTGRTYYLTHQIPLDLIYPALLALTLACANLWFGYNLRKRRVINIGIILVVAAAIADYTENLGVTLMILSWPEVPSALVQFSSMATILKSVLTTVAVFVTIYIAILWAIVGRRNTTLNV
jgi:hypothetical protein